jgi:serine/threonine-protein kinase
MAIDARVLDLLLDWEERQGRGEPVSLEELCRGCPDLLGELKRRVRELQEVNGLLSTEKQGFPPAPSAARPAPPPAGDRYRPLRFHDRGNLGEVWVAEDMELRREVALKRIQERRGDVESRRRFLIEAEVTGRLQHPGVVPVYGLVRDANGEPYYAMRFIEGESLKQAVAQFHAADRQPRHDPGERNLALRELLNRFVAVCKTVAYAHSKGVIHRDLKPANIMLGKYGETLVVDWGLAKRLRAPEAGPGSDAEAPGPGPDAGGGGTRTGWAQGTPAYMSPEQAEGRWDEVGPTSDIYSLGATLYTLLTGELPRYQSFEVGRQVKRGALVPPRRVNGKVPPALEAVCLRAMALPPEGRYGSAQELAQDVEKWLADERVTAYREPVTASLARLARRHKPVVAGGLALLVSAVVALAVGNLLLSEANEQIRREKAAAEGNLKKARHFADKADGIIQDNLVRASEEDLRNLPGAEPLRRRVLNAALQHYRELAEQGEEVREFSGELADVQLRVARIEALLGTAEDALKSCRAAIDRCERLLPARPDLRVTLGRSCRDAGNVLFLQLRKAEDALPYYERAIQVFTALLDEESSDELRNELAATYNNRGLAKQEGDREGALRDLEEALAIRRRLVEANPHRRDFQIALAKSHSNVGNWQRAALRYAAAPERARALRQQSEENARTTLQIWERLAEEDPAATDLQIGVARSLQSLGTVHLAAREPAKALDCYGKARAIWERLNTVPEYQYYVLFDHRLIALAQDQLGDRDGARRNLEQACDGWERLLRYHDNQRYRHECASCYVALARVLAGSLRSAGEPAERQKRAEQALESLRRAAAHGYKDTALLQKDARLEPLRSEYPEAFRRIFADPPRQ